MSESTVSSSLPELLGARASERGPGLITATRGKLRRLFCVEGRDLVFAVSNLVEDQFLERLVRAGLLSPAERGTIQREAARAGRKAAAVAIEAGIVDETALREEIASHVRTWVADALAWTDGQFRFDAGRPDLGGEVLCAVPIPEVILEHTRSHPARIDAVRVRIGPPDLLVHVDAVAARALDGLAREASVDHLLRACEGPTTVADAVVSAPGGPDAAYRALYGMLLLRALRRGDSSSAAAAVAAATRTEKPVTREEIEGWIARARSASHYDILGVATNASAEEIRHGYYRHARRLHPDRIRSGPFRDLLDQVEDFFAKVTEAHNTLSLPDQRREYDQYLAELAARTQTDEVKDTAYLARQNFLRGRAALERRRFSEALSFLENAVRLDDGPSEYHRELGRVLAMNPRRREEAEERMRRAIAIDPSAIDGYLALADMFARTDRADEAASVLREALRWEPGHPDALARLKDLGFDPSGSDGGLLGGLFGR